MLLNSALQLLSVSCRIGHLHTPAWLLADFLSIILLGLDADCGNNVKVCQSVFLLFGFKFTLQTPLKKDSLNLSLACCLGIFFVWCLILNIALEDFFICWSVCNYFCFHHSLKFVISRIHRLGWDSFYVSCKIHHHCVNRWRAISNALSLQKTRKGKLKGFCKNASRNGRNTIQLSYTDKASFFLSCLIKKKRTT